MASPLQQKDLHNHTINAHILNSHLHLHLLLHPVPLVVNKQKYNEELRTHQTDHYCHTDVSGETPFFSVHSGKITT